MDCFPLIPPEETPEELKEKMRREVLVATAAAMELHEKAEEEKAAGGRDGKGTTTTETAKDELKFERGGDGGGENKPIKEKKALDPFEEWFLLLG